MKRGYRDRVAGARATWLQPPGSPDLSDAQRAKLIETAALIKEYERAWSLEQVDRIRQEQRAAGYL